MELTLSPSQGVPEKAFLSLRVGETRKLAQLRGRPETFRFETARETPRQIVIDVFERVGSRRINVADIQSGSRQLVAVPRTDGSKMHLDLELKEQTGDDAKAPAAKTATRQQDVKEAKEYLDSFKIGEFLQEIVQSLLRERPTEPFGYIESYIKSHTGKASEAEEEEEEEEEFPIDGSAPLPDLTGHHSMVAAVLRNDMKLYDLLNNVRTPLGVALALCVKPAVDVKGHPMVKTPGLVAGDPECYNAYANVFWPVASQWHRGSLAEAAPEPNLDSLSVSTEAMDADGGCVISVQISGRRNIEGMRFAPAMPRHERREVEQLVVAACGSLKGDYFALHGSTSYAPAPEGMSEDTQASLAGDGLLPKSPESAVQLASGLAADWPQARGVFASPDRSLAVIVNEEDHLRIVSRAQGADIAGAFSRFCEAERALADAVRESRGRNFARNPRFGFLAVCPSNTGTAMSVSVTLCLPKLGAHPEFKQLCARLELGAKATWDASGAKRPDTWDVSGVKSLDIDEVGQVNRIIAGCKALVGFERRLAGGEALDSASLLTRGASAPPSVSSPAASREGAPGGFPVSEAPEQMPDVADRHSIAAQVLRSDPSIYERLRTRCTSRGVTFASCVKTTFDNRGHPMIVTIGAVAGDQESYETFAELFDPIIRIRHPDYELAAGAHPEDLDAEKVKAGPIDEGGGRVLATSITLGRNLAGLRWAPTCSAEERREAERYVTTALTNLSHDLVGEYLPLHGSQSFSARPGGVDACEQDRLVDGGIMFEEPDSDVQIASGFARDWPDARGVFLGANGVRVWVNAEDHVRIMTTEEGDDLAGAFARASRLHSSLEQGLRALGQDGFARCPRRGFLGPNPSSLGTALVASVKLVLPVLPDATTFRALCKQLGLRARLDVVEAPKTSSAWEVSNMRVLGTSEVEQVSAVMAGCQKLLNLEGNFARGEPIPAELAAPDEEDADEEGDGSEHGEDCSLAELPNLASHHSIVAKVLCEDPGVYDRLRDKTTSLGVGLARCVKPGIDNPGHPMLRTLGLVAGDAACYDTFQELFELTLAARFPPVEGDAVPMTPASLNDLDATGHCLVATRLQASRNLSDVRFPPTMSWDERREVERLVVEALHTLSGELEGAYYPLQDSESYGAKPEGMPGEVAERLRGAGLLFEAPSTDLVLSTGVGRHWPDARGVFANGSDSLAVWVNEEDHVKFLLTGPDLAGLLARARRLDAALQQSLGQNGHALAKNERLGFLTADPTKAGTGGLTVCLFMRLPHLGGSEDFRSICKSHGAQARPCTAEVFAAGGDALWHISLAAQPRTSEAALLTRAAAVARAISEAEARLERGS